MSMLIDPSLVKTATELNFTSREEWLDARSAWIGSSDSAALLGVGYANQNVATVWEDKVFGAPEEKDSDRQRRFDRGAIMEESVARLVEFDTDLVLSRKPYRMFIHPTISYLAATPDALTTSPEYGDAVVELKQFSHFASAEWQDGAVPLKFNVQVQHQMFVTGRRWALLAGWMGGDRLELRWIERDERFCKALAAKCEWFWGFVKAALEAQESGDDPRQHMPPCADGSTATTAVIKRMYPTETGQCTQLGREFEPLLRARKELDRVRAVCAKRIEQIDQAVRYRLGEDTFGICGEQAITLKSQKTGGYTRVIPEGTTRVLRYPKSLPKGIEFEGASEAIEAPKAKRISSDKVKKVRDALWKKHPHCTWCGRKLKMADATLEHIVPVSRTTREDAEREENYAIACQACNNVRGDLE